MSTTISQKFNNTQYAPGIALYGVDGMDGISGQSGTSLFICQYSIEDSEGIVTFGNYVRQGRSLSLGSAEYIGRSYMNGDAFLFPSGYIYKIVDIDGILNAADNLSRATFDEYMELVGQIVFSNQDSRFSDVQDRFALDTANYKGFLINLSDSTDVGSIDSPFTIISDTAGNDGMIRFIDMRSIQAGRGDSRLRIYFDNDNRCFVINSTSPLLIDADLQVSNENTDDNSKYDEFSRVLVNNNPLTKFRGYCDNITYTKANETVRYEYDVQDSKTSEIYYFSQVSNQVIDSNDGGSASTTPTGGTNYTTWKFKTTSDNSGQFKKVVFHMMKTDNVSLIGWNIKFMFTKLNNDRTYYLIEGKQHTLVANGGITLLEGTTLKNGMYITKEFYVPNDATEMWLSAPTGYYILSYGHGIGDSPNNVNRAQEEEKRQKLLEGTNKYSVDVLRYATAVYTTKFTIKNTNSIDFKSGMIHIIGLMEDQVDREYFYRLSTADDRKLPANGTLDVSVSSYNPGYSLKWEVGFMDKEEIILGVTL